MSHDDITPFAQYLSQVRSHLAHLTPEQWARVTAELSAHLEDTAIEQGRPADDPAFQRDVIAALGPSRVLGHELAHVYREEDGVGFDWRRLTLWTILHAVGWFIGMVNSGVYADTYEPQIALAGALAAALSVVALPERLRRGRGWLLWLLASVPVWLLCTLRLATINWEGMGRESDYEGALLGTLLLTLGALGVTQAFVLRAHTRLALGWMVVPVVTLNIAFMAALLAGFPFAVISQLGFPLRVLGESVFALSLGGVYGLVTGLALQLLLAARPSGRQGHAGSEYTAT